MASIDKRIEALERLLGTNAPEEYPELERRREELKARIPSAYEKAAREEAEGNPARLLALDELRAQIGRRGARRGA